MQQFLKSALSSAPRIFFSFKLPILQILMLEFLDLLGSVEGRFADNQDSCSCIK